MELGESAAARNPSQPRKHSLFPPSTGLILEAEINQETDVLKLCLQREHVADVTFIAFRPKTRVRFRRNQLGGDAEPFSGSLDSAFHDIVHAQFTGYFFRKGLCIHL